MKKIAIVAVAVFAITGTAFAYGPDHRGGERMVEHMSKKLDLSEAQSTQLQAVFDEQGEKMKALHDETQEKINAILTPEQREKMAEMKEKRKERMEDRKDKRKEKREKRGE